MLRNPVFWGVKQGHYRDSSGVDGKRTTEQELCTRLVWQVSVFGSSRQGILQPH